MTRTIVKLVRYSKWRTVEIVCTVCGHHNLKRVEAGMPLQSGEIECQSCGATLGYEEVN